MVYFVFITIVHQGKSGPSVVNYSADDHDKL